MIKRKSIPEAQRCARYIVTIEVLHPDGDTKRATVEHRSLSAAIANATMATTDEPMRVLAQAMYGAGSVSERADLPLGEKLEVLWRATEVCLTNDDEHERGRNDEGATS